MWYLWKARNDHRFNKKEWKISNVLHAVQADILVTQTITHELQTQQNAPSHIQNTHTIHTHTFDSFAGTKCYVDAAITPEVQGQNPRLAGLGILIQASPLRDDHQLNINKIFIQASVQNAANPLQAEAHGLTLASAILKKLNLHHIRYFTDSNILATNMNRQDPVTEAADWRIRPTIADFLCNSQEANYQVHKIPRKDNSIAHTLANQAKSQANFTACLFACNSPLHSENCVVRLSLENTTWGAYSISSVTCI
ncbi:unnamed protein product [Urochloa humidicola]